MPKRRLPRHLWLLRDILASDTLSVIAAPGLTQLSWRPLLLLGRIPNWQVIDMALEQLLQNLVALFNLSKGFFLFIFVW